jgi:hypothetical protein
MKKKRKIRKVEKKNFEKTNKKKIEKKKIKITVNYYYNLQ